MEKSALDIWMDRGIKAVGILGFIGATFMAINGMLFLPKNVSANETEIRKMKEWSASTNERLIRIEENVKYLVQSIDEIKRKI